MSKSTRCAAAAALLVVPALAQAQGLPVGTVTTSASIAGITQLATDLDGGGNFHWGAGVVAAGAMRQFTRDFAAGVRFAYEYEQWYFSAGNAAFHGVAPWRTINRPALSFPLFYSVASDWVLGFIPQVQWAFESDANASDALNWGAVFTLTKIVAPDKRIGLGVGVYSEIEKTQAYPFLVVDWKIDDRWRIANALPASPAGGAGLEAIYTIGPKWEAAGGASYRSYRFRLDESGPYPNGIGVSRFVPVFARLTYSWDARTRADLYAGASVAGKLQARSSSDAEIVSVDYSGVGAVFALTVSSRF